MKRGFTLVELSIVLVIIGLLIGGILVGQSLIESAKIQSFVRMLQQYDIAHIQFQQKFKQLPGDTSLFPITGYGAGRSGANDGKILDDNFTNGGWAFRYEIAHYWKHLFQAGMIPKDYAVDASTGVRAGVHIPETPFKGAGLYPVMWPYETPPLTNLGATRWSNQYTIADYSQRVNDSDPWGGMGLIPTYNFATSSQALAIDTKIDDGKAYANVDNYNQNIGGGCCTPESGKEQVTWESMNANACVNASDPTGQTFNMNNPNEKTCFLFYVIGTSQR